MDERKAIAQAQAGDGEAFRQLVETHQGMVYRVALAKTRDPHDAEEVTQTVFCKAWQSLPGFRGQSAFSSWLYRLTVNAATDLLRQQGRQQTQTLDDPALPLLPDRGPTPEESMQAQEEHRALREAIAALPDFQREVFLLREVEGLSYQAIAQALELEEGTVKSRLARTRLALREALLASGYFEHRRPKANAASQKGGRKP